MEHTHDFPVTMWGTVRDDAVCSTCGLPIMEGAALFPLSSVLDAHVPEGHDHDNTHRT